MKNTRFLLSENVHFFVVNFSVYLNRLVFVMQNYHAPHLTAIFLAERSLFV